MRQQLQVHCKRAGGVHKEPLQVQGRAGLHPPSGRQVELPVQELHLWIRGKVSCRQTGCKNTCADERGFVHQVSLRGRRNNDHLAGGRQVEEGLQQLHLHQRGSHPVHDQKVVDYLDNLEVVLCLRLRSLKQVQLVLSVDLLLVHLVLLGSTSKSVLCQLPG